MIKTIVAYGREIVLEVSDEVDLYGQFMIRLTVDGRVKSNRCYNNHGEMPEADEREEIE